MNCPKCSKRLIEENEYYVCQEGDGVLITNKHLMQKDKALIKDIEKYNKKLSSSNLSENEIPCPKCENIMHKVDYNFTGIIIDSCTNCHYRWLDSGELSKIKDFNPNKHRSAEDLLYLLEIDKKIEEIESKSPEFANKRLPGYGTRGGFPRGYVAGSGKRTVGFLSVTVFYGIVTGLVKSKLLRVLIPITLIAVAGIYYYVISELK